MFLKDGLTRRLGYCLKQLVNHHCALSGISFLIGNSLKFVSNCYYSSLDSIELKHEHRSPIAFSWQ